MDIQKLRHELASLYDQAKGIKAKADAEKRDLTEPEAEQISGILSDCAARRRAIDDGEARASMVRELSELAAYLDAPVQRATRGDADALRDAYQDRQGGDDDSWRRMLRQGARGKLVAFRAIPELGITAEKAKENAYRSGMWASAALFGNNRARQWCQDHGVPIRSGNLMDGGDIRAVAGGSNQSGEYLVPDEMLGAIIDLRETFGVARQLAAVQIMSREVMTINKRVSGLTMYPVGRVLSAAITESNKVWGQIELRANTWAGLSLVSRDLADDAVINMADDLTSEFAYAAADAEDGAYFLGDGTPTYHGVLGWNRRFDAVIGAGQLAGAVDAASNHDTWSEIDATDLGAVAGKAPEYVAQGGNAKWVCSKMGWETVFKRILAAGGGNTVDVLTGAVRRSYLGDEVVVSQKMPSGTLATDYSDATMLLYGDFRRGSVIGDRMTFSAQVLQERYAELRQIGVIGATRFDVNCYGAGDATTPGPVVALIGD